MKTEFQKIQTIAFFAVLLGVGIMFYHVIAPYIYPLFWAAVLAGLFFPFYDWLRRKLHNATAAAGVTVATIVLLVMLPLAAFFGLVAKQAIDVYNIVSQPQTIRSIQTSVQNFLSTPTIEKFSERIQLDERLQSMSKNAGEVAVAWLTASSLSTITLVIQFGITLYTLFFFLKNGEEWLKKLMFLLPFGDDNERTLYKKFVSTSRATLKGGILVAALQGSIGGILFWIVGIPSAAFWGLIMTVMAMIPAIGTIVVWAPAALYMFVIGHPIQGFIILCGGLFITIVDNIVRPPLIGKDIQMHPVMILFSTIGGLSMFGISGVVVGPLIASLFLSLLQIYEDRYKKELGSSET